MDEIAVTARINDEQVAKIMEWLEIEKAKNWVAFPVPEGCRGIAVSFDREVAQMQVDEHGATPLFGLSESDDQTEAFLPIRIYVTDGGDLIPDRKYQAPPERLVHATQTHGRSER